jgi:hypothetical protein
MVPVVIAGHNSQRQSLKKPRLITTDMLKNVCIKN